MVAAAIINVTATITTVQARPVAYLPISERSRVSKEKIRLTSIENVIGSQYADETPTVPDALAVRAGRLIRRHFIVPTAAIDEVDGRSRVVALTLRRNELQRFL